MSDMLRGTSLRVDHANGMLRGTVVIALLALLLFGGADREPDGDGEVMRIEAGETRAVVPAALLVRSTTMPPDPHELDVLASLAAGAPLLAALPAVPGVRVSPPQRLVAGRATALPFELAGDPGVLARVELRDDDGLLDSARVRIGADGTARAAFRVRPARDGWHEWRIVVESDQALTGGWAVEAGEPRVLVAAGPATPEARFVVAALEESGAAVELRQPLGHGLAAGGAGAAIPATAEALREYDVVIVLDGAHLDGARRAALASYASDLGGGVLLAIADTLLHLMGLADGPQPAARSVTPDALYWQTPAELLRLPGTDVVTGAGVRAGADGGAARADIVAGAAQPIAILSGATPAAWTGDSTNASAGAVLVLRATGAGRTAALGVRETWRWRVAGGWIDEHREFWRSLVDWLSPPPAGPTITTPHAHVAEGLPVRMIVEGATSGSLVLRRPDGRTESLPLQPDLAPGAALLAFIPVDTGLHTIATADGVTRTAVRAGRTAPRDAAALLALRAAGSGGRAVHSAALSDTLTARAGMLQPHRPAWTRAVLFALLVAAVLADWSLRRLRGLA
ncbi:MAG: hypothetical protein KFH98_01280 [Gemmatimonadetes bacterium]|nr:hypothetical protein [Gemmatimonadota bacterium]